MSNPTIGAFATVKWLTENFEETVLFVIGDTPDEIDEHDRIIFERIGDTEDISEITVIETTHKEWWDVKHGTNIGKGWYISNTDHTQPIKKDQ